VEAAGALANSEQNAFLEDLARRVVRQLDVVDAGHDRREDRVAAVLPDDRERRVESSEATDRKARAVIMESAVSTDERLERANERTIQS
jgi:hypothetical protein